MVKRPIHRMDGNNTFIEMDDLADEMIISIFNNGKNGSSIVSHTIRFGRLSIWPYHLRRPWRNL